MVEEVRAAPSTPVKTTSMFGEHVTAATFTQLSTALVVRKEPAPKSSPARKDAVDRKGKGKEKRPVFLLDEMAAMTPELTGMQKIKIHLVMLLR